jgi:hypothetical protein
VTIPMLESSNASGPGLAVWLLAAAKTTAKTAASRKHFHH